MSGVNLDSGKGLGPAEAPSIQETGLDLNNLKLYPIENRVSEGVAHIGDSAWRADQVIVPTAQSRVTESTVTSSQGGAKETNKTVSNFRGIDQVGAEEYQRTLFAMTADGASAAEAYKAANAIRYRVTSVGGTGYSSSREALQAELAAEALATDEPLVDTDRNASGARDSLTESTASADPVGDDLLKREDEILDEPLAERLGEENVFATERSLDDLLADLEGILDNGNVVDLGVEEQLKVVTGLKNKQLEELAIELDPELRAQIDTEFAAIRDGLDSRGAPQDTAVDTESSPELQAALDRQLETVRSLKNRMGEDLSARQKFQIELGAQEEEALTF